MSSESFKFDGDLELSRFLSAQIGIYDDALAEIKAGKKRTHWMWFIFPQFRGLGRSENAVRYAIRSMDEASAYLRHPILGKRLKECTEACLLVESRTASEIFGYPDDIKFRSSMTLFAEVSGSDPVFELALDRFFDGIRDERTLELLDTRR